MRRPIQRSTVIIGARVTPVLAAKLQALSRQTQRDKADVLRLLIQNATVGTSDIQTSLVDAETE
jgi:hypothetical protein